MSTTYPFDTVLQMKLLALLARHPGRVLRIIDPKYFTAGQYTEVAQIVQELYDNYLPTNPDFRLDYDSLKAAVLAKKTDHDERKQLKRLLKNIYDLPLGNSHILIDEAKKFLRTERMHEVLIQAERQLGRGNEDSPDKAFEIVKKAYESLPLNGANAETSIRALRDSLQKQMDKPPKEVEWDVPGFFPMRATILFAGRKGEGKSYLLQALGKASREGSELVKGLPVTKRRFLYLVREGGQELYDQRFRELEFDYRKQSRKFQLWGPWMEPMPPKILETGAPYREWAKEFAPCAIAIDGLRRFFDGDENSSEVMDPVGQELTSWTRGASVYIAHHRGRSKSVESRGSTAIEDCVSVQYVVEARREGRRISKIEVRCVKNWYGEEKTLLLEPHWDDGKFWFTGGEDTQAEDRWARDKEKVLSRTSVTEWRSRTAILEDLEGEIGRDRVIEILDSESGNNGKLRAKRGSKPGAPFEYRRVRKAEADSSSDSGEKE
jgi:hypothetical protein